MVGSCIQAFTFFFEVLKRVLGLEIYCTNTNCISFTRCFVHVHILTCVSCPSRDAMESSSFVVYRGSSHVYHKLILEGPTQDEYTLKPMTAVFLLDPIYFGNSGGGLTQKEVGI